MEKVYEFKNWTRTTFVDNCGDQNEDLESWLKLMGLDEVEVEKTLNVVRGDDPDYDFSMKLKSGKLIGMFCTEESTDLYITTDQTFTPDKANVLLGGMENEDKGGQTRAKLIEQYCVEMNCPTPELNAQRAQVLTSKGIPVVYTWDEEEEAA